MVDIVVSYYFFWLGLNLLFFSKYKLIVKVICFSKVYGVFKEIF